MPRVRTELLLAPPRSTRATLAALATPHHTLPCVQAEFIAIFDADFLPLPDFLLRCIPVFQDKNVGFVQGRWTYENADESLFCRYQVQCNARRGS